MESRGGWNPATFILLIIVSFALILVGPSFALISEEPPYLGGLRAAPRADHRRLFAQCRATSNIPSVSP